MNPGKVSGIITFIFIFCLQTLWPTALWPLEVKDGRIKLVLHEGIGRFSLYILSKTKREEYIPLFVAQDPRTSFLRLIVDDRVVKPGESSEYQEKVEKTEHGARFIWDSGKLKITEEFTFLSSTASSLPDGVKITFTLANLSDRDMNVGLKLFLDTYLGEEGFPHFKTNRHSEINRELTITKDDMIRYWVSPSARDPDEVGLQCMIFGEGITVPDLVVFANWERLDEATWGYETSPARNFNLLPYSINDSAVSQYYQAKRIPKGTEIEIVTILGNYNPAGFKLEPRLKKETAAVLEETSVALPGTSGTTPGVVDLSGLIQSELDLVNNLLAEIDRKLNSGETITEEEITLLHEILGEIKSRAEKYPGGTR